MLLCDVVDHSMRITVLPTPAPPNRPILPPFEGNEQVHDLMPVSSSSTEAVCSTKLGLRGGWADIFQPDGAHFVANGRPTTFMMRPRDAAPTGAMIGLPVSTTSMPRTRPSVASMAMVRTTSSPRCWPLADQISASLLGF